MDFPNYYIDKNGINPLGLVKWPTVVVIDQNNFVDFTSGGMDASLNLSSYLKK